MKKFLSTVSIFSLLTISAGGAFADPPRHEMHGPAMQGPAMHGHSDTRHHPEWHKGGRIDRGDWNRGQRVDYRVHHLRSPPRGYEWREVDGNYVLAAVATGVIASIILANH